MVPVARTSVLAQVFAIAPSSLLRFHALVTYALFAAVLAHTALFYAWVPVFARAGPDLKAAFGIDNPTVSQAEAEESVYAQSVLASGVLALAVLVAVVVTSLPGARRRRYNTFYCTHLLTAVFFVLVCLHASTDFYMLLPGLALWVLDWGLRFRGLATEVEAGLRAEGNGWFRLAVPVRLLGGAAVRELGRTGGRPLKTWYLRVARVSRWQVHPFTAARMSGEEIVFLWRVPRVGKKEAKVVKEWTARLARLVEVGEAVQDEGSVGVELAVVSRCGEVAPDEIASVIEPGVPNDVESPRENGECASRRLPTVGVTIRLEGPYSSHHSPFESYSSVLCVVGGTGISGALSLAEDFLSRQSLSKQQPEATNTTVTENFGIVWSIRESDDSDLIDVQGKSLDNFGET